MRSWDEADLFTLPLLDGNTGWGQVVARLETGALILLTRRKGRPEINLLPVAMDEVLALLRVPPAPLDDGTWAVHGFEALPRPRDRLEPRHAPEGPTDPAVVEAFLSACHGLLPWDYFPEKGLFDRLLLEGVARPV